jgi:spore maturation protein CgeB
MKRRRPLRIAVLGLSLSSSWGNGHATTYRALLGALAARGHDILFLERDVPWYASHRDLTDPPYCRLAFYESLAGLERYRREVARSDVVIVGSYVPDGIEVGDWVLRTARGLAAFYDIDTPVTLAQVEAGTCPYLARRQIPRYGLYLSFTGGPVLDTLGTCYGARRVRALYCSADNEVYCPRPVPLRWDIGYLGTYSADRQPMLERLLIEPARRFPNLRFVVAGACFPDTIRWPANVSRIPHLGPDAHPEFYSSLGWALNVTRAEMVRAGYSPSVRLFEAAACGAPLISDDWPGLSDLFAPGREIVIARDTRDMLTALEWSEERRLRIARAGRARVLREHTSHHRAARLEALLFAAHPGRGPVSEEVEDAVPGRNRSELLTFQAGTGPTGS